MTSLKIKYNPFAKAFLDAKERTEKLNFATSLSNLTAYPSPNLQPANSCECFIKSPYQNISTCERHTPNHQQRYTAHYHSNPNHQTYPLSHCYPPSQYSSINSYSRYICRSTPYNNPYKDYFPRQHGGNTFLIFN